MSFTTITMSPAAIAAAAASTAIPVLSKRLKDDSDGGGAPPPALDGEVFVVRNWGVGVYVGAHAGDPFADGDVAEQVDSLGGFVRLAAGIAGLPPDCNLIVISSGAAGSFLGRENQIVKISGGAYAFTVPQDHDLVRVVGDEDLLRESLWGYDILLMAWVLIAKGGLSLQNALFVDQARGSDTTGIGTLDLPFKSIGYAIGVAPALGPTTIFCGPGQYFETLLIDKQVNLAEIVPGTVTIWTTDPVTAAITYTGFLGNVSLDLYHIRNDGGGPAVRVQNSGVFHIQLRGKIAILDGGTMNVALDLQGDPTFLFSTSVDLECNNVYGSVLFNGYSGADLLRIIATQQDAIFDPITCLGAGGYCDVSIQQCNANQRIVFGGGVATGANLLLGPGDFHNCMVYFNNAPGGFGEVYIRAGTSIGSMDSPFTLRPFIRELGGGDIEAGLLNVPVSAIAGPQVIYQIPFGPWNFFSPFVARSVARMPIGGGGTAFSIDGTAPGSVVAAGVPAPIAMGVDNLVVLKDAVPAGTPVTATVTAGTGVHGDVIDILVQGKIM